MFVVSGVTGHTGSIAAQTLIDQGHPVRVLVRSPEKGDRWAAKGAGVAVAEIMDQEAMIDALTGATCAFFLLPPDLSSETFIEDSLKRAEAIVAASKAAGLPHAVILSSVGAQFDEEVGPISTVAYLESLFVKASIPATAIRPGYFLENIEELLPVVLNNGIYPSMIQPLDLKIDMVATKDIGAMIAEAMVSPIPPVHRVIELKGADQYSANDVASAFSKALDRDIAPVAAPEEGWIAQLKESGLSQQSAESMSEMHRSINSGRITFLDPNAKRGKVDLESFIQTLVA